MREIQKGDICKFRLLFKLVVRTLLVCLLGHNNTVSGGASTEKLAPPIDSSLQMYGHQAKLITGTRDKDLQKMMVEKCKPNSCDFKIQLSLSVYNSFAKDGQINVKGIRLIKSGKVLLIGEANETIDIRAGHRPYATSKHTKPAELSNIYPQYKITAINSKLLKQAILTQPQDGLYLTIADTQVEVTFTIKPPGFPHYSLLITVPQYHVPLVDQ